MCKATKIKAYLMKAFHLLPHHFDVDVKGLSRGSLEHHEETIKMNPRDISSVNRIFDVVHGVRVGEQWFSVTLIAKGVGDSLVNELNEFLEKEGEETIKLEDNQYFSESEGFTDLYVEQNGKDTKLSLAWKIKESE